MEPNLDCYKLERENKNNRSSNSFRYMNAVCKLQNSNLFCPLLLLVQLLPLAACSTVMQLTFSDSEPPRKNYSSTVQQSSPGIVAPSPPPGMGLQHGQHGEIFQDPTILDWPQTYSNSNHWPPANITTWGWQVLHHANYMFTLLRSTRNGYGTSSTGSLPPSSQPCGSASSTSFCSSSCLPYTY